MKLFFTLFLLVTAASTWAQGVIIPPLPVDARTRLITYSEVVPVPGTTQATLLARAKVWANRVSVPAKLPIVVNELGTDVLVVAASQQLPDDEALNTTRLYFLAKLSLREGRFQYRLEEFTFETNLGGLATGLVPAEVYLISAASSTRSQNRNRSLMYKQFEQAIGQVGLTLRETMLTPLVPLDTNGTEW